MRSMVLAAVIAGIAVIHPASAFEGRITATVTRGGDTHHLLYTTGTNFLRIDCVETDHPYPSDILDTSSQEMTLVFHHNRSFVQFPLSEQNTAMPPGFPPMTPNVPQAPAAMPASVGPTNLPGATPPMPPMPNMPAPPAGAPGMSMGMPMMPPMPMERIDLAEIGDITNILGYRCVHYKMEQRGETMDIWATDQLLPFQAYLQNQPLRRGLGRIEEQWSGLLKDKKLFPLLGSLKFPNGVETLHFEVTEIKPEEIKDQDGSLSHAPADYYQIQPLPF